jgi:C1A family cysteine protease
MNFICQSAAYFGLYSCDEPIAMDVQQAFMEHINEFGLSYGTQEEFEFRMGLFAKKDAEIKEINASQDSFTLGHNQFSTWTDFEYKRLLGFKQPANFVPENVTYLETSDLQDEVNWITKGGVNAVKNQGQCGSCWAFSATAATEGAHFVATKTLLSLSEQQFVDCDKSSHGCNGGWQSNAFKYAEGHAQDLEKDYVYTARTGTCQDSKFKGVVSVKSYATVPAGSVAQLKAAIAKQPVSVTVEADKSVFQSYKSGVLDSAACGTSLDHAITAVGYGVENGKQYYLVRNSWGASWGDKGYIKIAAVDGKGICGIQQVSVYPSTN